VVILPCADRKPVEDRNNNDKIKILLNTFSTLGAKINALVHLVFV